MIIIKNQLFTLKLLIIGLNIQWFICILFILLSNYTYTLSKSYFFLKIKINFLTD